MLTTQEKMLCEYYLVHFNRQKAMRQAGYGSNSRKEGKSLEKYLHNKGSQLFAKQEIKDYIDEKMKEIETKLITEKESLLKYLARCVAGSLYEKKVITYRDDYEIIDVPICIKDRTEAAKLLFKYYDLEGKGQDKKSDKPKLIDDVKPNNLDDSEPYIEDENNE